MALRRHRRRLRQDGEKLSTIFSLRAPNFLSRRQKFFATYEVAHRHCCCRRFMMRLVEVADSRKIAMAMTAYSPFAETRAGARGSRSKWRRFLDAMIGGRRRKAEDEVARYLRRYWYQLPRQIRDEFANRTMGS
jgi:hypothetical protein